MGAGAVDEQRARDRRRDWVPTALATGLVLLLLGPALGPGFVLSYDLVWVPDLALRPDFWGSGTGLPRAVPSDAVVALLDELIPGSWLQKVVLAGPLIAGGAGAAALLREARPGARMVARLGATVVYIWNPFVVERLVIGHWPVLVAYGVAPWLWLVARRRDARAALWWLLPLGSLSASAGLASAVIVLAAGCTRRARSNLLLGGALLAANAPWLAAGILHAGDATSDPDGAAAFALRGEGPLPAPLAALSLGGIWNSEVVPGTRETVLAWVALAVLAGVVAFGWSSWWPGRPRRDRVSLAACWLFGYALALGSWLATDAYGWLAGTLPGAGLIRDGTRLLGLCGLLLAVLVGHGIDRIADLVQRQTRDRAQAVFVAGVAAVLPVAVMIDAAWGSGDLRAVAYPPTYGDVRAEIGDAGGSDVLLLPFTSYRAPDWNHHHKVLDPWGRYLEPDFVASDELLARGRLLRGEDPRGADVRQALDLSSPQQRAERLADLGVGYVVTELDTPGDVPGIEGEVVFADARAEVTRLADPAASERAAKQWWLLGPAWAAYFGALLVGLAAIRRRARRFGQRGKRAKDTEE